MSRDLVSTLIDQGNVATPYFIEHLLSDQLVVTSPLATTKSSSACSSRHFSTRSQNSGTRHAFQSSAHQDVHRLDFRFSASAITSCGKIHAHRKYRPERRRGSDNIR